MKILNLYAGIGGNRKLWGEDNQVTAIEYDENIAKIYKDNKPIEEPSLQWLSHWEKADAHGMFEYIEINKQHRQIKCNGCLDILYDLIKADLVEKVGDN